MKTLRNILIVVCALAVVEIAAGTNRVLLVDSETGQLTTNTPYLSLTNVALTDVVVTNLTIAGGTNFPASTAGLLWWNTSSNLLYCCDGTNWQTLW